MPWADLNKRQRTYLEEDMNWVHNAVSLIAQFQAQDNGRTLSIDYTTIIGALPPEMGQQEPVWLVYLAGQETDRGEYWWPVGEYWTVTRKPDGTPVADDATIAQIVSLIDSEEGD